MVSGHHTLDPTKQAGYEDGEAATVRTKKRIRPAPLRKPAPARQKEDGGGRRELGIEEALATANQHPYPYRAVLAAALAHESTTFLAERVLAEANPAKAQAALDVDGDRRAAPPARRIAT